MFAEHRGGYGTVGKRLKQLQKAVYEPLLTLHLKVNESGVGSEGPG